MSGWPFRSSHMEMAMPAPSARSATSWVGLDEKALVDLMVVWFDAFIPHSIASKFGSNR